MKRTLLSSILTLAALGLSAQTASVSGTFEEPYIAGMMCPTVAVFTPANGNMSVVEEKAVQKPDYTYSFNLTGKDDMYGKIAYVGYNGEFFPFYVKAGEKIEINAIGNIATYGKAESRENQILAQWTGIIAPLHHLSHDKATTYAKPDSVAAIMDKAWQESEALLKSIDTGNKAFDDEARFILPYQFMYEALQVFGMGWCAPKIELMPKYVQHIFTADNFADERVWSSPFAAEDILWFSFAKDIICGMKMGQTINYAVSNVSNAALKETYALYSLENNLVPDIPGFLSEHEDIFISDDAKARLAEVKRKVEVLKPGNDWVDMEYEDRDGKMHKLSEFLGNVIVIDVWATWCAPCRAELPHLLKLEKEMEGRNVVFIGYSIDEDKAAWKKWLTEHEMPKNQLWTGRKGPIIDDYKVLAVPQFLIFSKDGKLISLNGPRPSTPKLKELIENNL